uniref:Uncharacterized protein n=2 Tax=Parascaris univalens TaxID=6257 RepID=A0A915C0G1_PARUN
LQCWMAMGRKRAKEEPDSLASEDHVRTDVGRVESNSASFSASDDDYVFWLIRKPTKISLNDIAQLKFPPGAMRHSAALTSPNSAHTTLHCHFEPARTQILHIPMNNIRSQKDTIRLKAVNELCGTVFITENEALDAAKEADTSAGIVQNGCDKHVTCEPSFEIHSIRKKPKLPLEGVRERVRAFGVVSKKKRDKLPNLISNS